MKSSIHKFPIPPNYSQFDMWFYEGSEVLHVEAQDGTMMMWVQVPKFPPSLHQYRHTFVRIGTGWIFDDTGHKYITTYKDGSYVWHLYEYSHSEDD